MPKGFGTPINKNLGYVLKLVPDLNAYAAAESALKYSNKGKSDEPSVGITSSLSMARVWKSRKQAEKGIQDYLEFLVDWLNQENLTELTFFICALKTDDKGNLITEVAKKMHLGQEKK